MGKKKKKSKKKKVAKRRKSVSSQGRTCAMMTHHYQRAENDPEYCERRRQIESFSANARFAVPERSEVVRIPVVVHVIYNDSSQNISEAQIQSQIDALNRDFRMRNADRVDIPEAFRRYSVDTMIEFGLAVRDPMGRSTSGVTRTRTDLPHFPYRRTDRQATEKLDNLIKKDEYGKSPWPRDDYLNLWVCNIEGGLNGLLGYAAFPGESAARDGVVVNLPCFGTTGTAQAPFDLGRTTVHEVGHWLNLLHIWGDDRGGCSGSDNVGDTPNQAGPNGSGVTRDSFPLISCNNGPDGDMFMNYMDYVDDEVMVMFTEGQLARMNATLAGSRAPIMRSQGLVPVNTRRVAFRDQARFLADNCVGECGGDKKKMVFDGVSWISHS